MAEATDGQFAAAWVEVTSWIWNREKLWKGCGASRGPGYNS